MSGGFSAGVQRATTGQVDWGRVAIDGAIGGLAGGAGAWAGGARALSSVNPMLRGGLVGAGENVIGGAATRAAYGQNPFDPQGMAQDVLLGGGLGAGGGRLAAGAQGPPSSVDVAPPEIPSVIYREGAPSPSNLRLRPGEEALSFRDSLSNPWPLPEGQRPVFRPGQQYIGIDTSGLPHGSVVPDNVPPGHVSVQGVSPDELREAVVERGPFPK